MNFINYFFFYIYLILHIIIMLYVILRKRYNKSKKCVFRLLPYYLTISVYIYMKYSYLKGSNHITKQLFKWLLLVTIENCLLPYFVLYIFDIQINTVLQQVVRKLQKYFLFINAFLWFIYLYFNVLRLRKFNFIVVLVFIYVL